MTFWIFCSNTENVFQVIQINYLVWKLQALTLLWCIKWLKKTNKRSKQQSMRIMSMVSRTPNFLMKFEVWRKIHDRTVQLVGRTILSENSQDSFYMLQYLEVFIYLQYDQFWINFQRLPISSSTWFFCWSLSENGCPSIFDWLIEYVKFMIS